MNYLEQKYFDNFNAINREGSLVEFEAGKIWRSRTFISYQHNKLYYILKGKCTIIIDDHIYEGFPGMCFFIPAYTRHKFFSNTDEPFQHYYIHFDLYPSPPYLSDFYDIPYAIRFDDNNNIIYNYLLEYTSKKNSSNLLDKLYVKTILIKLIIAYIELSNCDVININYKENSCLNNLLAYIDNNLHKKITLDDLSKIARMHVSGLIDFFKENLGMTPSKYITQRKMELAKRLLDETDIDISEVMERTGYEYTSHFSKLFKKYYGISPTLYNRFPATADSLKNNENTQD